MKANYAWMLGGLVVGLIIAAVVKRSKMDKLKAFLKLNDDVAQGA
jgi:uncharacterized membrane-anchored protein YhcB (DUF1043 family)